MSLPRRTCQWPCAPRIWEVPLLHRWLFVAHAASDTETWNQNVNFSNRLCTSVKAQNHIPNTDVSPLLCLNFRLHTCNADSKVGTCCSWNFAANLAPGLSVFICRKQQSLVKSIVNLEHAWINSRRIHFETLLLRKIDHLRVIEVTHAHILAISDDLQVPALKHKQWPGERIPLHKQQPLLVFTTFIT